MTDFEKLDTNDVEDWFGSTIFKRGVDYQRSGRVSELHSSEKRILASVDGTRKYTVSVEIMDDGELIADCNCPYEYDCKHAVAVILEYLQLIQDRIDIPEIDSDDRRLLLLNEDIVEDFKHEGIYKIEQGVQDQLNSFLNKRTKEQLVEQLLELAGRYPEVADDLQSTPQIFLQDVTRSISNLRRDINRIGDSFEWNGYNDEGENEPNYDRIRLKIETLTNGGHADDVLPLCTLLIEKALDLVGMIHDDGDMAIEMGEFSPVIIKVLEASSLGDADKLIWVLDVLRKDQYETFEEFGSLLDNDYPESVWNSFIDQLDGHLDKERQISNRDDDSRSFERGYLAQWMIHGLEKAGRTEEIIPLCITEAVENDEYDRLVERLMALNRFDEAEEWIHKGIKALGNRFLGITSELRKKYCRIMQIRKNYPAVAQLLVEEFVRHTSTHAYEDCRRSAEKIGEWRTVRSSLLKYLETGRAPWLRGDWSLPKSGLETPKISNSRRFPLVNNLLEVALLEKDPERILYWFDRSPKEPRGWFSPSNDTVASAVQTHAPDRAVEIWQKLAESLINQVKPSAYEEAARYLRKASKVMSAGNKLDEWRQYLLKLRETHKRKRRLMDILDQNSITLFERE